MSLIHFLPLAIGDLGDEVGEKATKTTLDFNPNTCLPSSYYTAGNLISAHVCAAYLNQLKSPHEQPRYSVRLEGPGTRVELTGGEGLSLLTISEAREASAMLRDLTGHPYQPVLADPSLMTYQSFAGGTGGGIEIESYTVIQTATASAILQSISDLTGGWSDAWATSANSTIHQLADGLKVYLSPLL